MAKSIPGQLSMFSLWTSEASPNATSSPGSGDGPTPSASPGGQTTAPSGQDRARASRSRSQAKAPVQTIQGTCGPTSIASSPPSGPLSLWENRLRDRLAMVGSTECALIWREKVTPAGGSIFRLARWTPLISDSGSTGSLQTWGTPTCHMAKEAGYPAEFTRNTLTLTAEAHIATWPTPRTSDEKNGNGKTGNRTPEAAHRAGWTLPELTRATWPTPMAMDHWMTNNIRTDGRQKQLPNVVAEYRATTWPTPTKADGDGGHTMGTASVTGRREDGTKITVSLPGVVKIVSTWRTPATTEPGVTLERLETADGQPWTPGQRAYDKHTGRVAQVGLTHEVLATDLSGPTTSGSPEQTANRGALNPAFPCWLMGYPTEWDACAPTATPSSRRSRQK